MHKRYTLTMSSKDVENPEYTLEVTMISETGKNSRVIIYSSNNKDDLLKKCYDTHNIALVSMLQAFFNTASKDKLDIEESDNDYFYRSLAEAIFYYVDSEFFCNHFAYNEIIIEKVEIIKFL